MMSVIYFKIVQPKKKKKKHVKEANTATYQQSFIWMVYIWVFIVLFISLYV